MKKIKLFTLLLFSISAFSQSWLPVGNPYVSSTFPWGLQTSSDADFKLNSNNVPYVFYQTDLLSDGLVKKYENGTWSTVGNTNFAIACTSPSLCIKNNAPYIAYQNEDFKAEVRRLNGPTWQLMGAAGFSPDLANYITIRVNSNDQPFVAYADGSQLGRITVKKFNFLTSQWESVGAEGFSTLRATHVNFEIASNNDLYVSYLDGDENDGDIKKVCVKKFDGTSWISIGQDRFTANDALFSSFALDNNNVPYVIYSDVINDLMPKLNVQKFNGTSWEYVGAPRFSLREAEQCDIDFDANNKPNIVYIEPAHFSEAGIDINAAISCMVFENGNWQFKGGENFNNWSNSIKPCIEFGTNGIAYLSDDKSYFDSNSDIRKEGYIAYFGVANQLVNPTLASISQNEVYCSSSNQYFQLAGLQPNSTSTIEYNINGVVQPNITNLMANSNGYTSFGIIIPVNLSGQTLTITKVTRTDVSGATPLLGSFSTIVQSNDLLTYYQDNDGDGLGNPLESYQTCQGQPLNFVLNNTDCDDSNPDPFVNTFSNPTPSVCITGSPTLVAINDNSRPVSGTTGGCLNANYGQFPSDYTPTNYDGVTPNIIATNCYAGEYSVVNVVAGNKYIFKSERFYNDYYGANSQNDRVTIGSIDGTTILASGQHTAVWQATSSGQIRFYSHANYNFQNVYYIGPCGTESFSRTRSIICAPNELVQPMVWSPVNGLFTDAAGTIPYTGQPTTQVYAKPNQSTTYSLTSATGCQQANAITVISNCSVTTTINSTLWNTTVAPNKYLTYQKITLPAGATITKYGVEVTNMTSNVVGIFESTSTTFRLIDATPSVASYGTSFLIKVKLQVNGTWSSFGTAKVVSTSALPPVANLNTYCGQSLPKIDQVIYCTTVPLATNYTFEVSNGTLTTMISNTLNNFKLTNLDFNTFPVVYNASYSLRIKVKSIVNGSEVESAWSSPCTITTPANSPLASIISGCGLVTNNYSLIKCTAIKFASDYKFVLTNNSSSLEIIRPYNSFSLKMITGVASGTTYDVKPFYKLYGQWYEGESCNVTAPGNAIAKNETSNIKNEMQNEFLIKVYPNPFVEHFKFNVISSSNEILNIRVYDILGKLIETKELTISDIEIFEIGTNYPSGIYNIVVLQGDKTKVLRVIKR